MATGKELARTVSCGAWKTHIKGNPKYITYRIYDNEGRVITAEKAKNKVFCKLRITFRRGIPKRELALLETLLQIVASTSSEMMGVWSEHKGYRTIIQVS